MGDRIDLEALGDAIVAFIEADDDNSDELPAWLELRDQLVAWLERNIVDAAGVAEIIGLAQRNNVYSYRRDYANFPKPILTHGRCYMWLRSDIEAWKQGPRERKR